MRNSLYPRLVVISRIILGLTFLGNRSREAPEIMKIRNLFMRHAALSAAIIAALSLAGCGDDEVDKFCDTSLTANIDATLEAAKLLEARAKMIEGDVAAACAAIASDLGEDGFNEKDVAEACRAADRGIAAHIGVGIELELIATPPRCHIDAQARVDCEAGCQIDIECTEPELHVRCEEGKFAVECDVDCEANVEAYCELSAEVVAECQGSCEGYCEGGCEGSCSGSCDGRCDGKCEGSTDGEGRCDGICHGTCEGSCSGSCSGTCAGQCEGSCRVDVDAKADCGARGDFYCRGGCSKEISPPRCEGSFEPPRCEGDAQCHASCEAQASFAAECTEGELHINIRTDAEGAETLVATLEANLPRLLLVVDGYGQLFKDAGGFVRSVQRLAADLKNNLACTLVKFEALGNAAAATAKAAASVSVTVEFSACVSVSASTSGETAEPTCG